MERQSSEESRGKEMKEETLTGQIKRVTVLMSDLIKVCKTPPTATWNREEKDTSSHTCTPEQEFATFILKMF